MFISAHVGSIFKRLVGTGGGGHGQNLTGAAEAPGRLPQGSPRDPPEATGRVPGGSPEDSPDAPGGSPEAPRRPPGRHFEGSPAAPRQGLVQVEFDLNSGRTLVQFRSNFEFTPPPS